MGTNASSIDTAVTPQAVFSLIADQPGAVWLDSSFALGDRGHRSFIARGPMLDASLADRRITLHRPAGGRSVSFPGGLSDLLALLEENQSLFAVGYVGYEAAVTLLGMAAPPRAISLPQAHFLFYESVAWFDHSRHEWQVTRPDLDSYEDLLTAAPRSRTPISGRLTSIRPAVSAGEYLDSVSRILDHIHEGDIYQANYTTRITAWSEQRPFDTYLRLRLLNPAPYSAYLDFGNYQVLSSSPERLLRRRGDRISTGPIKGTIARGDTAAEAEQNRMVLAESAKDRAELLMIVDLARNDLGQVAETGSVTVDSLFRTETYSSVIHLVGDVSARLRPGCGLKDLLTAVLPGGSITGAPKHRAVEILTGLERVPRSVYTGAIGWAWRDQADFNVAIRTLTHRDGEYHVHAGGGIVADSTPESEYAEMLLKARNLLRAVGGNGDRR